MDVGAPGAICMGVDVRALCDDGASCAMGDCVAERVCVAPSGPRAPSCGCSASADHDSVLAVVGLLVLGVAAIHRKLARPARDRASARKRAASEAG